MAELRRHAPEARVSGIAAGLHALIDLPAGVTERAVIAGARERGLALTGLATFDHGSARSRQALVVGYAKPPEHAFTAAVARLTAALGAFAP
ncbi:MAG TPA: hypothetical protein VMF57_20305 [Solirubrobacteraceae bacterium]|nr:hypothetical protein [Solirubrobacteraceae bacterium]